MIGTCRVQRYLYIIGCFQSCKNNNVLFLIPQESFYHGLSDEELVHVDDYNFDHPGITRIS
jgi:hypothetical protein